MCKNIVLGLDISLSTGWAIFDNSKLKDYGIIKIKEKEIDKRIRTLTAAVLCLVDEFKPTVVIMEDVFKGPNVKTLIFLSRLQGAIINIIPEGTRVEYIYSSSARKNVLKADNKNNKENTFNWIVKKFKLEGLNFKQHNDITDAILLAYYGFLLTKQ